MTITPILMVIVNTSILRTIFFIPYFIFFLSNYKMNYSTYEYNDWLIGSGAMESYNKKVVTIKIKTRWYEIGANYLIVLRCMCES